MDRIIFFRILMAVLILLGLEKPLLAGSPTYFKKIDFGFHLTLLAKSERYKKALDTIAKGGILYISVYEPFTKNLYKDQKKMVAIIKEIMGDKFNLLISLSDYPYEGDAFEALYERNANNVGINKKQAKKIYDEFSNRFPPSNINSYSDYLRQFVLELKRAGLLNRVTFEVGSEPDSYLYFWGNASDFKIIFDATYKVLSGFNVPMLCCGMTTQFSTHLRSERRQTEFYQFIDGNKIIGRDIPFSSSWFFYTDKGYNNLDSISYGKFRNGFITSFNIHAAVTEQTRDRHDLINSYKFVFHFAKLLDFAYRNNIKRVYLWRLMDSIDEKGRLGFFDVYGEPKPSYEYFLKVNDIIKNGFMVERTDKYIMVVGNNMTLYVALKAHEVNIPANKIMELSSGSKYHGFLKEEDWLIYEK